MPDESRETGIQAQSPDGAAPPSNLDLANEEPLLPHRTRLAGTFFGACVGIPLGALVAAVCCWLTDYGDYAWQAVVYGAISGIIGGAIIGFFERWIRGDLAKADVGTFVGIIFGLLIAFFLLAVLGIPFAGRALIGLLFIGPMAGLIFGAVFDRMYESAGQQQWLTAIQFGGFGLIAIGGIVFLVAEQSDPDLNEVAKAAQKAMYVHPEFQGGVIRNLKLQHSEHRVYLGSMEVTFGNEIVHFDLEIQYRHEKVVVQWQAK